MRDYMKVESWAGRVACWYGGVIINAFKTVIGKGGRDHPTGVGVEEKIIITFLTELFRFTACNFLVQDTVLWAVICE
jgi:hypothetical protein